MKLRILAVMSLWLLAQSVAADPAAAVSIEIDPATKYQKIDGFGFFGPSKVWWGSADPAAFYNDQWLDLVLNDLGLTIHRNEYYAEEAGQDANWAKQAPFVKAIAAKAKADNIPLKFILTVWSPPSQWKTNKSLKGGGHLLPAHYADFGKWLVQGIKNYESVGAKVYAISPQNEPLFSEPYNSCQYTREEYHDMIKVAVPIIKAAYPDVKIFGPEHMLFGVAKDWDWNNQDPSQAVLKDPDTCKYLDIWACHGYGPDGATPTEGSTEATFWTNARQRISPFNKPLWMTETSGYKGYNGTLRYAMAIHAALYYGHVSGWVHWYGADDFFNGNTPTKNYYAAKQFYRFVRPEAVRIGSTVKGDNAIFATAFQHDNDKSFTVVAINGDAGPKTVKLVGTVPDKLKAYRTSENENGVDLGTVSKDEITLAPRSVTTLYDGPAIGAKAAPAKTDPEKKP